ncbi:MJ0042 family finger-like domain [Achromobacter spanius]|uniref:DUF3426 domain-containing protein n=1 Tax=Achromobacter spanius TaxID=217203 RepID=UPI000C2C9E1B|nr:DUF3426 domain-containing protein [Achromobacter spanius]AUA55120.1 hypothetical protein CVS48_03170 [Achromobacter spanius]CAB3681921.1 hypothetical protein LMG5911_04033 [Achromobacter spanius]SPT41357.1 MJ0042 family finger-like domain [Achromobacter denitrificans]VEE57442.1 MJ0042 family finger-like domain [Achromobacter spanius]
MALTTRCPQCGTTFKVVPDQLRVRNGLVRCGACSTVFDGRACLLPEAGSLPPSAPPVPPVPPVASSAAAAAAPVLAPTLARPSAEPRQTPPWEDEPAAPRSAPIAPAAPPPAPVAPFTPVAPTVRAEPVISPVATPAIPPAVLRGRDAIRRPVQPEDTLPEDEPYDDHDLEDEVREAPHGRVDTGRTDNFRTDSGYQKPIIASRDNEPIIKWDDRDAPDDDDDRDRHDDLGDDRDLDDDREPVLGEARTRYSSATDVGRAPPEFLDQDRSERRGLMRKIWGYACLLGLIALGLQLLYVYRTDIANSAPALRPVLETVCQPLGCTVGYARRLERIAISSSSLQPPTGAAAIDDGRSRLVLNLVLRNRYDKPQHWPALVLDLTDLSDTVVVRKVLKPEDYLTPEQLRGPFAPAGELKISVPIEVTGVQVNGYQLDKFFP